VLQIDKIYVVPEMLSKIQLTRPHTGNWVATKPKSISYDFNLVIIIDSPAGSRDRLDGFLLVIRPSNLTTQPRD
jgi:hypothetical protein